jgi:hypothetical protein
MTEEEEINNLRNSVCEIIEKYANELFAPNKPGLTPYEKAAGFTESNRGGAKSFGNKMGKPVLEEIWGCSDLFTRFESGNSVGSGGCDGHNDSTYFESKSRANTMKASEAVSEIRPKLQHAISEDKDFVLLVLVDIRFKKTKLVDLCENHELSIEGNVDDLYARLTEISDPHRSRKIPLHEGKALREIQTTVGYDPERHLWISGLEAFRYLFPNIPPTEVMNIITCSISDNRPRN